MILFDISSAAWKLDDFKHELWESSNIGIPWHDRESNDATIFGALVAWFIGLVSTVKFLNFWTPENFAVIYLKFKHRDKTLRYFVKKMQMEKQTVKTLISLGAV